jgi:hypothetical protein
MNHHAVTPFRRPIDSLKGWEIEKIMASHLVAAVIADGLDTSNDIDVISCLLNTPDRFHHRVVLDHMDSAMVEAKQILIAKEMGEDQ